MKINGTTWLNNAACANLYTGQSAYFKQGIYRAKSAQTQTIYHTGTRIGPSEVSVERDSDGHQVNLMSVDLSHLRRRA